MVIPAAEIPAAETPEIPAAAPAAELVARAPEVDAAYVLERLASAFK